LTYRLSASFDDPFLSGITTLDLVLIVRHLLGLEPFLNPYKIIASDFNGDYNTNVQDVRDMRKIILGVVTDIPTNNSWNFLRSDFEFIDPLDPFQSIEDSVDDPFSFQFNSINNLGYDFTGIKTGDIAF